MLSLKKGLVHLLISAFVSLSLSAQMKPAQIDSMKKKLVTAKEDTSKVILLAHLGDEVGYNDGASALQYGKEALALSKKINYPFGVGKAAYLIGITAQDMGDLNLADSFLTLAETTPFGAKPENLARINNARGSLSFMKGNYYSASDYYTKAATYFEHTTDTESAIIAYQNLISVLAEVKNFQRAVELGKKVLPITVARHDTLSMGYCLQGLTTDLIYMDSLREAEQYMLQLIPIVESTVDNNLSSDSYSTIGTFYYFKKDYSRALPYFMKAVEKAEPIDNKFQLANHTKSIGSTYLKLGNLPLAKKYLDESMRLAHEYNNARAVYDASIDLSEYFEKVGNTREALSFLKEYLKLKDSILNVDSRNYTAFLEQEFESKKKENQILRLQKVDEEKNFQLKQRKILFFISAALLIVVITISLLVYKNQRNKHKITAQERVLQDEKIMILEKQQQVISLQSMINGQEAERTRIARDLHDGLGGIFSTVKMHYSSLQHDIPDMKLNAIYKKTFDLINSASDELRKVAHNMMPEVLMKLGLVEALKDFCNNINAGKLLRVKLQVYGMEKRLSDSKEIMLFRIIQELVNNIIKHADATEALIQFNRDGNQLTVTIEDNGKGFDPLEVEERQTMGMSTVRSRVDYLNGKLTIDSRKGIGTSVIIDILLNEN